MRVKRGAGNIPTASGIYLILFGFYFTIGGINTEYSQTQERIGPFIDLATCQQVLKDYEHNYFVIEGCREGL